MNKRIVINLSDKKTRFVLIGIVVLILSIVLGSYYFMSNQSEDSMDEQIVLDTSQEEENEPASESNGSIYIDVSGAVLKPQVIILPEGSRVYEAIDAAGGITEVADISMINKAAVLQDGDILYIPNKDEIKANKELPQSNGQYTPIGDGGSGSTGISGGSAGMTSDGKININTADSQTLQQLNGVGPVTAESIIEYRTKNGNFSSVDDLTNVSGIGPKTLEKLRDFVRV